MHKDLLVYFLMILSEFHPKKRVDMSKNVMLALERIIIFQKKHWQMLAPCP
jgi:hypothetical protein